MADSEWLRLTHVELGQHLGALIAREREHIDAQMQLMETLVEHERELREADARERALALRHQAGEYERRLNELNNEARRIEKIEGATITKAMYERDREERGKWERGIETQLNRYAGALAAMAVVLTLLSLALRYLVP